MNDVGHIDPPRPIKQQIIERFLEVRRATNLDLEDHFRNHGSGIRSRVTELEKAGVLRKARDPDGFLLKWMQEGFKRQVWEIVPGKKDGEGMNTKEMTKAKDTALRMRSIEIVYTKHGKLRKKIKEQKQAELEALRAEYSRRMINRLKEDRQ